MAVSLADIQSYIGVELPKLVTKVDAIACKLYPP